MALTQDQRIEISKKIVSVPAENAVALDSKSKLQEAKVKAQNQDDANKALSDAKTTLINGYQKELNRLDGNSRSEILEQDFVDSAVNKIGNFFFPNQMNVPTPSLSDGIWKQFIPYSRNKAIGKFYNEAFGTTQKEGDIISLIQGYITSINSYTEIKRTTGQKCTAGTPPAPDLIEADTVLQGIATNIITEVGNWKTFLQTSLTFIVTTDTNTTRQNQNNVSIADINNSISVINTWLSAPNFDTAHGQTTCAGFESYNPYLLQATKFRNDVFNNLKNEITARLSYITTRIGELNTNLGSVTQSLSDGQVTASSGLYGERFSIINLRLNSMSGSLKKLEGLKLGQRAQDESISFNAEALAAYSSVLFATLLSAPSTGNDKIHLKDASSINVGDTVYITANDQPESQFTVVSKTGNLVQLSGTVDPKYRTNNLSRLYKVF